MGSLSIAEDVGVYVTAETSPKGGGVATNAGPPPVSDAIRTIAMERMTATLRMAAR